MSNVDHGAGPLYRDGPVCGVPLVEQVSRTECLAAGSPVTVTNCTFSAITVATSFEVVKLWYEPIEDEL